MNLLDIAKEEAARKAIKKRAKEDAEKLWAARCELLDISAKFFEDGSLEDVLLCALADVLTQRAHNAEGHTP